MQDDPRLVEALRRADQAGNVEDARRLAQAIADARGTAQEKPFWADMPRSENVQVAQPARMGRLQSFNNSVADMATFGMEDEMRGALVGAPVGAVKGAINAARGGGLGVIPQGISDEYQMIRDQARSDLNRSRQDNPVTSVAGSVAGAFVNPLTKAGGQWAGQATTRAGAIGRGAATGAVEGALYGAGSGETAGERAKGAAQGGAIGGGLGGGSTWLLGAVGAHFAKGRANARRLTGSQRQALNWLRDAAVRDAGGDKNAANGMLRVWAQQKNMDPEWLVRNSGENVRMLMEEAASDSPTPALQLIDKMRRANADAVYAGATKAFNPSGKSLKATRDSLQAARQAQAQPLYDAAYQTPVDPAVYAEEIAPLMNRPSVKASVGRAINMAMEEGDDAAANELRRALQKRGTEADELFGQIVGLRQTANSKRKSLTQYIVEAGGISDDAGDVMQSIGGTVRGRPGLINQRGRRIDDLIVNAVEDGYFPEFNLDQGFVPSRSEFLDAIDGDIRGFGRFSAYDEFDDVAEESLSQARADFARRGIDIDGTRDAIKRDIEAATGQKITGVDPADNLETLSTKSIHYILQGMDDRVRGLVRKDGAQNTARMVTNNRNQIADALKRANPSFAEAQDVWSSSVKMDEALDLGKKFIRPGYTVSDLAQDLQGMTKGERDMYRVGLAEQLRNRVGGKPNGANPARWMDNDMFKEKLRLLFSDSPDEAEAFIRVVTDADDVAGRLYDIDPTGNSRTARRVTMRAEGEQRARRAAGPAGAMEAVVENPVTAIPRAGTRRIAGSARERAAARMRETLRQAFFERSDDLQIGARAASQMAPYYRPGSELAAPAAQVPMRQNTD